VFLSYDGKGTVHPRTDHEGPEGEYRYSSTPTLTSALDEGWSTQHPDCFTPGKDLIPTVQEAGWIPELVRTGEENLAPTTIRSPDCPARSELLY